MPNVNVDKASFFGLPDEWFSSLFMDVNDAYKTATIVFVRSSQENKGHFTSLLSAIEGKGYRAKVYLPVPRTQGIITALGYKPSRLEEGIWSKR